jgi:hypothetical protein
VVKPIILGILIIVVILWIIWGLNYYVTGSDDLRNLPVFGAVPHVPGKPIENTWQSKDPPVIFTSHKHRKDL